MTSASVSLPSALPVFPLAGALVFPRGLLPLHIFEPRYRAMVRDALEGSKLIGMVQPRDTAEPPALFDVGCVGRISEVRETPEGRFMLTLSGLNRFHIRQELEVTTPYRQVVADYGAFAGDQIDPPPLAPAMRAAVEAELRDYLDARGLSADWQTVAQSDDEGLVNTLACVCPFSPVEKQALLEADAITARADILLAIMRFARAEESDSESRLQ